MDLERIYHSLVYEIDIPTFLGPMHRTALIMTLITTLVIVLLFKRSSEMKVRVLLFVMWVVLLVFELYRWMIFSLKLTENGFIWDFNWGQFPLQLCSVQLYALPFIVFLKKGKFRDSFICLMILWSLFGGLGVTIYPGTAFSSYYGLNLQSMIHHGIQVVIGILLVSRNGYRLNKKFFLRGYNLFIIYTLIALSYNIVAHNILLEKHLPDQNL